jgi:D-alanyl-D-alanine carboxypeptidase
VLATLAVAVALTWNLLGPGAGRDAAAGRFDGPVPACARGDTPTPRDALADWDRTLLDTEFRLDRAYVPPDLVPVAEAGVLGSGMVRSFVIPDLRALGEAARDAGLAFRVVSAYRSFDRQAATFGSLERTYGREEALRSAALPGHSEHQLGTTIDIDGGEAWMAAHGARFGFIVSYPAEASPERTCYKPEPWHLRYFGRATARAIVESGRSAREWLWERQ